MEKSEKIEVIRNSKSSRRTISFDEDFEEIKAGENDRNLRSRYREDRRKLACSWLPLSRFSLIDEVGFSFFLIGSSIFRSSYNFSTILTRIFLLFVWKFMKYAIINIYNLSGCALKFCSKITKIGRIDTFKKWPCIFICINITYVLYPH